jgi:hypothetical protein
LFNPSSQTVKEQWKILTFHPLEVIIGKPYNHTVKIEIFLLIDLRVDDFFQYIDKLFFLIPRAYLT